MMAREKPVLCNCGGNACICGDGGKWAAHCQDCDNTIGAVGFYDPCATSKKEAIKMWNELARKGVL